MTILAFVILWVLVILGGLPKQTQYWLEIKYPWFHTRFIGIASSFFEASGGFGFFRYVILMNGLGKLSSGRALLFGLIGFYMLCEGVIRLIVTIKIDGAVTPSLPVVAVFRFMKLFYHAA